MCFVIMLSLEIGKWGIFSQQRIGEGGKIFKIYKLRALRDGDHKLGSISDSASSLGKWVRKHKIDELPQLFNVLKGDMSFVGPRPDVKGFADKLVGEDRIILSVKPGITGPATLKYKNEEAILAVVDNPEQYNRDVIWSDKVEINKNYIKNWSFYLDLKYIIKSIFN